jgi:hypothetical protein
MRRHVLLLITASVLGSYYDHRTSERNGHVSSVQNVILVVSDGLRWQEVFRGADSAILFGDPAALGVDRELARRKYWRPTVAQRRAALMPFLWSVAAREGQLFGNRDLVSGVQVTNPMKFSYPGYNEMLTGQPDPRIDSNEFGPNPNVTVFEWLNHQDAFAGQVAAFGTWDTFRDIFNVERSRIHMLTLGARPVDVEVQRSVLPYLREQKPRAVFVGFAETDDWGHEGRYDRFLDAAHAVDGYIAELWSWVQTHPRYRGRTTIIFTADHGRGRGLSDWRHHGKDTPGSDESFIVMLGPGLRSLGERRNTSHVLGDVARATARAVGLKFTAELVAPAAR